MAGHPKVFISYSHDSTAHADRVLALSNRLRSEGIDTILDQYEVSPPGGWPKWMDQSIDNAKFVLVVCTETYLRRVMDTEEQGKGKGVKWESTLIYQDIYDADSKNIKYIPVLFNDGKEADIPRPLGGATRYQIESPEGYEGLYRHLTAQPATPKPELGKLRALEPKERKTDFFYTPEFWHMPHASNPYFTGREDVLTALHERLNSGGRAALSQSMAAISALGGMGKTQTAIEYAYRFISQYSAVLWVLADTRANMLTAMVSVAVTLGLAKGDEKDQEAVARAVIKWLEQGKGWLLILDNVEDAGDIAGLLPTRGDGHIIVTSRKHDFGVINIQRPIVLDKMSETEAQEFLIARTERARPEGDELLAVGEIVRELDCLPLAIEQAGAYIKMTLCRFRAYHAEYKARGVVLLDKIKPVVGMYPASVMTTWNLNFEKIKNASPASAEILYLSAFMHPEAIPQELFTLGAEALDTTLKDELSSGGALSIGELLAQLEDYSLIRRDDTRESFDIHRLVQGVIRHMLGAEDEKMWAERGVRLLNKAYPDVEFEQWRLCERLTPHAFSIFGFIDKFEIETEEAGRLFNQTGEYLYYQGRYVEAGGLFQKSVAIREKVYGLDHLEVTRPLNNLALVYESQGRYTEAEPLYVRALKIREERLEPDHSDIAISRNNMAANYRMQKRYAEAAPLYEQMRKTMDDNIRRGHVDIIVFLNNLANFYLQQSRYAEAKQFYEIARKIAEEKSEPDYPMIAMTLHNLAEFHRRQGKYDVAEPLFIRVLKIREERLDPYHPDNANTFHKLALLYDARGRHPKAETLYKKAVPIAEKARGNAHPELVAIYRNYAACLRKLNQSKSAKRYENLAADVMRRHAERNKP